MSTEFKREERYIVFKVADLGNSLKGDEIRQLAREYAEQRRLKGKSPLECVVVESDWPEYEPTWKAIETRVAGAQAQLAPVEQDTSVRKAWARFSNELHRSPDAPYPGMSEAFEQHFSQSFTDREWRAESATWAAAWKAAKRHEAQAQPAPSAPEGWLRAIDEALIVAHIGMANADDTYAQAKSKLDTLIGLHADIATDPAVNGGWKLVPTAESRHPGIHKMLNALHAVDNTPGASEWESYAAFLAATPEAKP